MAIKVELRGYFHEIGEPTEQGEKKTKVQKLIFMQFGYQDRGRGINEPDEPWVMEAVGKVVDYLQLNGPEHNGQTAKITVWIRGYAVEATDKYKAFSGYQANISKFELLNTRA